jgi:dihydrofolate reductase
VKCSVFIATSVDGFIAREDGSVDWLDTAGNPEADMGDQADMGFNKFIESVDCMIMGRGTLEVLSGFDLTPEQWPYRDARVIALSSTLTHPPDNLKDRVEMYSGDLCELIAGLESKGHSHAYVDGGKTIQSFLDLKLIDEIILTRAPVILGEGIPVFRKTRQSIKLENSKAEAFPNDFVQLHYTVSYQ